MRRDREEKGRKGKVRNAEGKKEVKGRGKRKVR